MDISKVVALPVLTILAIIIRTVYIKKHCPSKDTTRNPQLDDPCCSSSSSSQPSSWDVFLSFHGKDTRRNFTSHLYKALDETGILTFRDDPALEKGEEISSGLLHAIRESKMFVVVISENYARSSWCLDELVQILTCKSRDNQVVPVFYYVDPSDVRRQKGCFGEALDYHKKRYSLNTIDKWKSALAQIAELSGYHLKKNSNENESETIQKIVENVACQVSTKSLHLEKDLFGIDYAVEEIYQKLRMELNHVRAIGICGIPGIGKTTIAKAFHNKYLHKFDINCFIDKVKQDSQGGSPLLPLLNQVLTGILRKKDYKVIDVEGGLRKLKQILSFNKALIILDDLDQSCYSEFLAKICNLFSVGSRIIITTRDANLLNKIKVNIPEVDVYMVKTLEKSDSLKLFSYHAFKKPVPPENFWKLSLSFVTYAGGLPLALKVLGSSLLGRPCEFWKAKFEKVQKIPVNGIHDILMMSYDELDDETVKAIFLDIAFFFVGKDIHEAIHVFKSCDFFPDVGIQILRDRCLLTIDLYTRTFEMHSLIQDMGRKLGKSTRLFLRGNAWMDLQNVEGKNDIEGLVLDLTTFTHGQGTTFLFKRMPIFRNLRLFQIIGAPNIKGDFKNLFPNLRCIRWHSCPWTYIPSTFCPPNLVSLDMPSSKFKILWKGPKAVKQLNYLTFLNVSKCREMKRLPEQLGDLKALKKIDASSTAIEKLPDSITHLTLLEQLNLSFCKKLTRLSEQLGEINLEVLNLFACENLRNLPKDIWKLKLLKKLNLNMCSKLEQLPEQLGKMQCLEMLDASNTAIEQVPDSTGLLSRLQQLYLHNCNKLRYVPPSIWNLTSLKNLSIHPSISLPDSVKNMKKLTILDLCCDVRLCLPIILRFSSLKSLTLTDEGPILSSAKRFSLSELFNLRDLRLRNCTSLGSSLPELPLNLERLWIYDHISLEQLPDLSSLRKLSHLYIEGCISLRSISLLPSHLQSLSVEECTSLQELPDLSRLKELETLSFTQCNNLISLSLEESFLHVAKHRQPFVAHQPNREVAEWFNYKRSGHTISFDIPPSFGSNFLGLVLWVVYTCKASKGNMKSYMRAVITSDTESITDETEEEISEITDDWSIPVAVYPVVGKAHSSVYYIPFTELSEEEISEISGYRIKVSFPSLLYSDYEFRNRIGEVKVNMIGVHLLQDRPSTSVY